MPWLLHQYKNVFSDFYRECDASLKEAIDQRLAYLLEHGNRTGAPVSKPLGDGLFELRARSHRHQARFLYFFSSGRLIIVISAFLKKKSNTQSEITKAKKITLTIETGRETTSGAHYIN